MAIEAATTTQDTEPLEGVSSFAKSLFLGEIHEEIVFPYPPAALDKEPRVRELIDSLHEWAATYDPRKAEDDRWIGDDNIAELGGRGLLGLYVPEQYGGQGLSQTGYCRVSEEFAQIDATLSVIMGVHQSIGMKGIVLFGSDEQKERYLPDLATGRKLAAFALTEPGAGSDVHNMESRAVLQPDGSWKLNGHKRYIGNGSKAGVIVTFARAEVDGKDRHIALILEPDMPGFEVGDRYDTMGLRANDLRQLHFNDIRVPPENVLGEPGQGFRIAMHILNNGRLSLGTGSVGGSKWILDRIIRHVQDRHQFGLSLSEFELVQEKIGWMVSFTFGLESTAYLTTALVDAGIPDYSVESAILKVAGTEYLWYALNRALQLNGGQGYMRTEPYEKMLRDSRIFPIFEGANDVMRCFIALTGIKPLAEELKALDQMSLSNRVESLGLLAGYVGSKIRRELRPQGVTKAHEELKSLADPIGDQVKQLREVSERALREHKDAFITKQFVQKRLADAVSDIYAQIAVLSRVTAIFEDQGVEPSGQEKYIAETFCTRAAGRVRSNLDQVESNDDERMAAIAKLAYKRGEYGYALFD